MTPAPPVRYFQPHVKSFTLRRRSIPRGKAIIISARLALVLRRSMPQHLALQKVAQLWEARGLSTHEANTLVFGSTCFDGGYFSTADLRLLRGFNAAMSRFTEANKAS